MTSDSTHIGHYIGARYSLVISGWEAHATFMSAFHIHENVHLAQYTTMRVGGPARFFSIANDTRSIKKLLAWAIEKKIPYYILGEGSNVVISDSGFDGLIILIRTKGIEVHKCSQNKKLLIAEAGERWDEVVSYAVRVSLYGIENLSHIPGTVGAAPIQNIGAYGQELADVLEWIEVFDTKESCTKYLSRKECGLIYRDSIFKHKKGESMVVLRVALSLSTNGTLFLDYSDVNKYFELNKNITPTLLSMRDAIISIRNAKFPDLSKFGTSGSFFKNPLISREKYKKLAELYPDIPRFHISKSHVKIPLAWILENICNIKGFRIGSVGVHKEHALVLVHYGGGTAMEIKNFSESIRIKVKEKIGIMPEYEVRFVGRFN